MQTRGKEKTVIGEGLAPDDHFFPLSPPSRLARNRGKEKKRKQIPYFCATQKGKSPLKEKKNEGRGPEREEGPFL